MATPVPAQVTLSYLDTFEQYSNPVVVTTTGNTNGYNIKFGADSGPQDFKAIFGFDYSKVTFPLPIPPAPHSTNGTTKGLYLTVNKDATAASAAINLYGTEFISFNSRDYSLKFDLWLNWTNPATSTEHALFGINHTGNVTNRVSQSGSDGLFFALDGDGGIATNSTSLRDYAVFRGSGSGKPLLMLTNDTVFGPTPPLGPQFDNLNPGLASLFPAKTVPGYPTTPAGSAGLGWVSGEVRQLDNVITFLLNDTVIAQYTNTTGYTNDGAFMVGYNDASSTIGDTNNFAIFDNIRFEPNPTIVSIDSYIVPEADGIRMYYTAVVRGTPPFDYTWSFTDENSLYPTISDLNSSQSTSTVSRFFGPFDGLPLYFYLGVERSRNGNRVGFDGGTGTLPACGAICLSVGALSSSTGTSGSGTNFYVSSACGNFGQGCRWFRMTPFTNAAIATVSTEGSTYDTILGVYTGSISSPAGLTLVACNNDISPSNKQSRIQFETRPDNNYWLVVSSTNSGTLKLTYGYDVSISQATVSNQVFRISTPPLPSSSYQLLASTNLSQDASNWTVLQTTNFSANMSASNNILRYVETNTSATGRRFFLIRVSP